MNKPLLSILIPITPERVEVCQSLLNKIGFSFGATHFIEQDWQFYSASENKEVEIIVLCDPKRITIGEKRELLYKKANGLFSIQIDSDDDISDDAIELILQAIKENTEVDCITFFERCDMNGVLKTCNHSIKYDMWRDNFDGFDFVRTPFYKDVIKTEIAQSVPFPKIRYNEDEQWSMALKPRLKTEHHIDKEIYYYNYYPTETHEERYGFNQ